MAGKRILMLVGDYSEDYEVMCSYVTLRAAGHTVHVASPNKAAGQTIRTSIHEFEFPDDNNYSEKPGHKFALNQSFAEVVSGDYDGLLCPGGRGAEYIRHDPDVQQIVRDFADSDRPMASICNGLQVYTEADVVAGKVCVGYPDGRNDAVRAGAKWPDVQVHRGATEDRAFVDGNLVTAATWACLSSMLAEFLRLLQTEGEAWNNVGSPALDTIG